jgi:hypothetical protein
MIVDPVESVRGEILRKIVSAEIFPLDRIQRENTLAPEDVPYCRFTMPQSGEWQVDSQKRQSHTVIAEFDIMTRAMTQTQLAGQYAARIEELFGLFDRDPEKAKIPMPGWSGASAVITEFQRGTASTEADANIYYLPVLLYIRITLQKGAKYE